MTHISTNWKTSVAGLVLVCIGLLETLTDIRIPGFTMDAGPAIAAGIGLLMAKDGDKP